MNLISRMSVVLCIVALVISTSYSAPNTPQANPCVILVIEGLALEEITPDNLPHLYHSTHSSSIGLLNLRTIGGFGPEKILLGISAGSPANANSNGCMFLQKDETISRTTGTELYRQFFGHIPKSQIINPYYGSLLSKNLNTEYLNDIGSLGGEIHRNGGKTGLWGQSDPDKHTVRRIAGLLCADREGQIDYGLVGDVATKTDPQFPSGHRLDDELIWESYLEYAAHTDLSVFEWGEFSVLDHWSSFIPPTRYKKLRREAYSRLDRFFLRILKASENMRRDLMIISPSPPRAVTPPLRLGWVMLTTKTLPPGLLSSTATKNSGMVTPYDLHRYLARRLSIVTATASTGLPPKTTPGSIDRLKTFYQRLLRIESQRTPVLLILIYLTSILLVTGGAIALLTGTNQRLTKFVIWLLQAVTIFPVALILVPIVAPVNVFVQILFSTVIVILFQTLIRKFFPSIPAQVEIICWLTVSVIITDAILGGPLSRRSALGYSLISGARFYGIGNEYTGILTGTTILGAGLYLTRSLKRVKTLRNIGLIFFIVVFFVTFPYFGANIGDLIPLLTVFVITFMLLRNVRLNPRRLLSILMIVLIVFSIFAAIDQGRANPTHLGQLVKETLHNGFGVVGLMVLRKLRMNWKLVHYSRWTTMVILVIILFPVALLNPRGTLRKLLTHYPTLRHTFIGVTLAATGGFFFNDSGIVTAATTFLIPSLSLLALMISETNQLSPLIPHKK
jgi:hypothetical protein